MSSERTHLSLPAPSPPHPGPSHKRIATCWLPAGHGTLNPNAGAATAPISKASAERNFPSGVSPARAGVPTRESPKPNLPVHASVCVCVASAQVHVHFPHRAPSVLGGAASPCSGLRAGRRGSPSELEGGPFTTHRPASSMTDGETEAQRGKWRDSPQSCSDSTQTQASWTPALISLGVLPGKDGRWRSYYLLQPYYVPGPFIHAGSWTLPRGCAWQPGFILAVQMRNRGGGGQSARHRQGW